MYVIMYISVFEMNIIMYILHFTVNILMYIFNLPQVRGFLQGCGRPTLRRIAMVRGTA